VTIPLYAPVFLLVGVCALCPRPRWMRRVDWPLLAFWLGYLVFFTGFCVFMVWVAERVAA